LSITHHTRKRPPTGPRTTHGPQSPPWWVHWQHTHLVIREKEKDKKQIKRNSKKRSKAEKGKEQDHLKKTSLGPLRQGQRLNTFETKPCSSKEHKPPKHTRAPCTYANSPLTSANLGHKPVRPVPITGQTSSTKTGQTGSQIRSGRFRTADHTPKSQKCKRNAQAPSWLLG
jgi:hypothetical protein